MMVPGDNRTRITIGVGIAQLDKYKLNEVVANPVVWL